MKTQSIEIEILDSTSDFVEVKLPFLDIPVQMTHQFFRPRLESGYFKVGNQTDHLYSELGSVRRAKVSQPVRQKIELQPVANQI